MYEGNLPLAYFRRVKRRVPGALEHPALRAFLNLAGEACDEDDPRVEARCLTPSEALWR